MKPKILAGKVLIKPIDIERKLDSGIYIPETSKSKQLRGTVIAVGADTEDEKMEVIVGDIIVINAFTGAKIEVDKTEHILLNHREILYIE